MRASLSSVFGAYDNRHGKGDYQGLVAALAYAHPWVYAELAVPGYRIDDGDTHFGVGDVASELRVRAYRSDDGTLSAGVGLAATFPSGDADLGLGMGHVMLMPGAYALLRHGELLLLLQLSYGRSIGASHAQGVHAGHGADAAGSPSIVQPMNASELEHTASLAYGFHPSLRALVRVFGAVPIADTSGVTREAIGVGLDALFGRVDVSAELQLPLVGAPFQARSVLALGASW